MMMKKEKNNNKNNVHPTIQTGKIARKNKNKSHF